MSKEINTKSKPLLGDLIRKQKRAARKALHHPTRRNFEAEQYLYQKIIEQLSGGA